LGIDYLKKSIDGLVKDFEAVAIKLNVPFRKKDSIEKIKNIKIESTIRFILRPNLYKEFRTKK
jgi:hypothetical protein